jgi:hypothetical protein
MWIKHSHITLEGCLSHTSALCFMVGIWVLVRWVPVGRPAATGTTSPKDSPSDDNPQAKRRGNFSARPPSPGVPARPGAPPHLGVYHAPTHCLPQIPRVDQEATKRKRGQGSIPIPGQLEPSQRSEKLGYPTIGKQANSLRAPFPTPGRATY